MSVVHAGIALLADRPLGNCVDLLARIYTDTIEEMPRPLLRNFDVRQPGDVMLQSFGDANFLCNLPLGLGILEAGAGDPLQRLHTLLDEPALWMAYCHDEPGGCHGYALVERGRCKRRRLQRAAAEPRRTGRGGAREPLGVEEDGPVQPFERRWLSAPHFDDQPEGPAGGTRRVRYLGDRQILVPEAELTARLLHDGLESLFRVCPWDTLITPGFRFFRAAGTGEPYSFDAERAPPRRRPWWRWW